MRPSLRYQIHGPLVGMDPPATRKDFNTIMLGVALAALVGIILGVAN